MIACEFRSGRTWGQPSISRREPLGERLICMQKLGLEWLWRIKEEPSLFGRYWHDGIVLLRLVLTRVMPLAIAAHWRQLRPGPRQT